MIIKSLNTKCINSHNRLHITFDGPEHICFTHCCKRYSEHQNSIAINDLYNMDSAEFSKILHNVYNTIPDNHDYNTYYYCNTKNKKCIYNDETLQFIAVDLFRYCNIRCPMCHLNKSNFISLEENKKLYFYVLNLLKTMHLDTIQLTGIGKPFYVKKETFEWLKTVSNNDTKNIFIVTNGTMLNSDDIVQLYNISKNNNFKIKIMVSCSAITPETYQKTHNNKNFETVKNNIIQMSSLGLLANINFVIQKDNLHELEFYRDFWKSNNVNPAKCLANLIINDEKDGEWLKQTVKYKNFINKK